MEQGFLSSLLISDIMFLDSIGMISTHLIFLIWNRNCSTYCYISFLTIPMENTNIVELLDNHKVQPGNLG